MQELIDELSFIEGLKDEIDLSQKSILKTAAIKNLLEKEKKQIIEAYDKGSDVNDDLKPLYGTPEEYYNQTYKQKSIDAAELLYNIVKKEVDELNK